MSFEGMACPPTQTWQERELFSSLFVLLCAGVYKPSGAPGKFGKPALGFRLSATMVPHHEQGSSEHPLGSEEPL